MSEENAGGAGGAGSDDMVAAAEQTKADKASGRLTTFVPPKPNRLLINALTPVVRVVCLTGLPGLRRLPLIRRLPVATGLMKVEKLDFPAEDKQRLKSAVNSGTAAFLTPNHPEFFTDWMIDKMVMAQAAPLAACWATHTVVNGLGPVVQGFWLRNNLIAQIPGAGGRPGKDYSIAWASKGHGVLLHPEGNVGWHGDHVAPLFPGAVEMAMEAAADLQGAEMSRRVFIAPVVWKLKFRHGVSAGLHQELGLIETALELPRGVRLANPAERLYRVYDGLLARDEVAHDIHPTHASYFIRHARLLRRLEEEISGLLAVTGAPELGVDEASGDAIAGHLRRAERWLRGNAGGGGSDAQRMQLCVKDARRLLRFSPMLYGNAEMTEEHIAESSKRIRNDYLTHGMRHTLNKFLPVPVGPRTAHIRVPEPFEIAPDMASSGSDKKASAEIAESLRARMQASLDAINHEIEAAGGFIRHANPFNG